MKPQQRLLQVVSCAVLAMAALTACRKEVPLPTPSPDRDPKPTLQANAEPAGDTAPLGLAS